MSCALTRAMSSHVPSTLQFGRCLTARELSAVKVWTLPATHDPQRVEGEDGPETCGKPEALCTVWD